MTTTSSQKISAAWIRMPFLLRVLVVLVFNTVIGLFLTLIGFGGELFDNIISAQCIGLSIFFIMTLLGLRRGPERPWLVALGVLAGAVVGTALALVVTGRELDDTAWSRDLFLQVVLIGLLFGTIATYFFRQREQLADVHEVLQETRIQRLLAERERMLMQLRLLQAQIEPHFLFNTLANVDSLLASDVPRGRHMLQRLTAYLRSSLSHSRSEHATLGDELEVIRAYLDIMAIRMGERLQWREHLAPGVTELPLAPMLLQPLVENAIGHGLEPAVAGGQLEISAQQDGSMLEVCVTDNGVGLQPDAGGDQGVGLSNIRERLAVLYDGQGALRIEENATGGVCATLRVPVAMERGA